jgi:hypothetical protein
LPGEIKRICSSGLFSEVDEEGAHPGPVLKGRLFNPPTERRLGRRGDECAAAEAGLREHLGLRLEYNEDPPMRIAVEIDGTADHGGGSVVTRLHLIAPATDERRQINCPNCPGPALLSS